MSASTSPSLSTPDDIARVLDQVPELQILTPAERAMLAQFALVRHLRAGMDLYIEGAPASSFSVVASGSVAKKRAKAARPIGAFAILGTLPLLRRRERLRHRTAGLVAVTDTWTIEISYRVLDRLEPERREMFLDFVTEQALDLIERMERQISELTSERSL